MMPANVYACLMHACAVMRLICSQCIIRFLCRANVFSQIPGPLRAAERAACTTHYIRFGMEMPGALPGFLGCFVQPYRICLSSTCTADCKHIVHCRFEVTWRSCNVQSTAQPFLHLLRAGGLSSILVSYCGVYCLAILDAPSGPYQIYILVALASVHDRVHLFIALFWGGGGEPL